MSTVALKDVSKNFGPTVAADRVSFEVQPGEFLTLLGPSGCGKTTLLRVIAGFLRPSSGTVRIGDVVVNALPPYRRKVGLVFQSYALFPHMNVRDNVAFGLRMHGVERREALRRVGEILELVQLSDRAAHYPAQLSGGQQQRVALARALVTRPTVLLLDEPFSALDRKIGEHLRTELRILQRRLSISTILVTHAQDEALMLSDRIAVMNQGRIEQLGAPEQLYDSPRTRFVAEFLGRSNLVRIHRDGHRITIAGPVGANPRAKEETVAIVRPEKVRLTTLAPDAASGGYLGTIEDVQFLGHTRIFRVALDLGVSLEVMALSATLDMARPGLRVTAVIEPSAFGILCNADPGRSAADPSRTAAG